MAESVRTDQDETKDQWAQFRASPEEIQRLLASAPPFDLDAWMVRGGPDEWTSEDEAETLAWLEERETQRDANLRRMDEKLADLDR